MNALLFASRRRRRRHDGRTATVSIHVRNLAQMFNLLDPSPFWDRDLDRDAAEFIEEEFSDRRDAGRWRLSVHASEGAALAEDLRSAVARYYQRLVASTRRQQREQMRLTQWALLGGSVIFLLSMSARRLLDHLLAHGTSRLLDEGLIILAWLALWRPAESLVYGWVPLWRKRRMYERLAAMRVNVHVVTPPAGLAQTDGAKGGEPARTSAPPGVATQAAAPQAPIGTLPLT